VVYRALESRAIGVLVGIEQGVGHTDKIVVVCCTRMYLFDCRDNSIDKRIKVGGLQGIRTDSLRE
jgi:hypothetical protein